MNNIDDRLDYLLTNFTFQELSNRDKTLVRNSIGETEYNTYRNVIATAQSPLGAELTPVPSSIKSNLEKDFKKKFKTKNFSPLITFLVAGSCLLFGTFIGRASYNQYIDKSIKPELELSPVTLTDTIFVYKVDTIFKEIKSEPKVIIKEIIVTNSNEIATTPITQPSTFQSNAVATNERSKLEQKNFFTNVDLSDLKTNKIGKTVNDDSELMDLLVELQSDGLE